MLTGAGIEEMPRRTMITEERYKEAVVSRDAAEKIIHEYNKQGIETFKERWRRFDEDHEAFTDEDLIYAATSRSEKCKAGLAHPKDCGPFHQWTCSNVLKNIGNDDGHQAYPFSMYEIKGENQPSANGATTRPPKAGTAQA